MSKKTISKINELYIAESFLQVDFVKGYKYVDRAGEIVNYFHGENNKAPMFAMSPRGLVINHPDEKTEEVKVSPSSFWAHFVSPDSLEVADDYFRKKVSDVIKIIEVKEISRIGWRNYFVYEFISEEERDGALKKFSPLGDFVFEETYFTSKLDDVSLNFRIRKVTKNADTPEQEVPSILIDADFYKKYENFLVEEKLATGLLSIKNTMRTDGFLNILNEVLQNNG